MKNRTKKVVAMCMGALMALAVVTGCGSATETKQDEAKSGKVVVNIEGTVSRRPGTSRILGRDVLSGSVHAYCVIWYG